jgi:hypothetical protein
MRKAVDRPIYDSKVQPCRSLEERGIVPKRSVMRYDAMHRTTGEVQVSKGRDHAGTYPSMKEREGGTDPSLNFVPFLRPIEAH